MAPNATLSAPRVTAADLSPAMRAEMDALPGIFQAIENHKAEEQAIARALRLKMRALDSTRARLTGQWHRARKAESYILADRLKAQLDALPADDDSVTEAIHSAALALAPVQTPGASLVQRTAYKLAVSALVRRSAK